jgi:hypothetical protein
VSEVRDTLQVLRESLRGDAKPAPVAKPAAIKPAPAAAAAKPAALQPAPSPPAKPAAAKPAPVAAAKPVAAKPAAAPMAKAVGRNTAMARALPLPALHDAPTMPDLATETSAVPSPAPLRKSPPPKSAPSAAEDSFEGLLDEPPVPSAAEDSFEGLLDESPAPAPAKDDSFALGATVFAKQSPVMTAADEDSEEPELTLEVEEEVEILEGDLETVEVAPADRPSAELRTLSDLAAAFSPIEGNDRIGQADIADPTLVSEPPEAAAPKATKKKAGAPVPKAALTAAERAQQVAALAGTAKKDKDKEEPAAPPTLASKEPKPKSEPKALSEEQIRLLRERTQEGERRRGRLVGSALFLLFAVFLLFSLPMLYDPTRLKAQELLGERTKIAMGALAVLSIVSLVRTWAIQIQSKPVLLRPVTTALKVVTVTVVALVSTYFLPDGALGPMERAARFALPWACGGFYLALGLYGLMSTLRAAGASVIYAALLAVLSLGSLFGSYQALSSTVLEEARRKREVKDKNATGEVIEQLSDYATGSTPRPGTSEPMGQRKEVGASEAEDLRAIEEMQQRRQKQAGDLDKLHKSMEKLVK